MNLKIFKISYLNCIIDSVGIKGASTKTYDGNRITTKSNLVFTLTDGTIIYRVGTEVTDFLKGYDTSTDCIDDLIQTTGTLKVNNSKGYVYSRLITEPLVRPGDCIHPIEGILQYSQNGELIAELNYSNCSDFAILKTVFRNRVPWLFEDEGNKKPKLTAWKDSIKIELNSK